MALAIGDAPSDENFVGAIQIPEHTGEVPSAYNRNGGWACYKHQGEAGEARCGIRGQVDLAPRACCGLAELGIPSYSHTRSYQSG